MKQRKTSEEAMAEMENKQEPRDVMAELGLDEDDGLSGLPSDEDIAEFMGQPDPENDEDMATDNPDDDNDYPDALDGIIPDLPEIPGSETKEQEDENCPHCGNPVLVKDRCTCAGSELARQGSMLGKKIDLLFGPQSKQFGFVDVHSQDELEIIKNAALSVAQRKIKAVSVTLENGDKATILVVKDSTKVRRNKATKAEMEA